MTDRVTLRPGDYVSTEGMTEEQYHAVARAFMVAGCGGPIQDYKFVSKGVITGWSIVFGQLGWDYHEGNSFDRHLTIDQVLNATNAGESYEESPKAKIQLKEGDYFTLSELTDEQYHHVCKAMMDAGCGEGEYPFNGGGRVHEYLQWWHNGSKIVHGGMECKRRLSYSDVFGASESDQEESTGKTISDPIATLRQARQSRDEAEKAYQQALEDVREALGDEFYLTDVGTDGPLVDGEDMSDPANWREGDVLEFTSETSGFYTKGKLYKIVGYGRPEDDFQIEDDHDDEHYWDSAPLADNFKFHHRP